MTSRDENGRFKKGTSGNPHGRPKKKRELEFYRITLAACSYKDWRAIVKVALAQALAGDHQARKWLSDYLMGPPVQRQEVTGADGGPVEFRHIQDLTDADLERIASGGG